MAMTCLIAPTSLLALASIAVSLWAGGLYDIAERASADLLAPDRYIEAILEDQP